MPPAFKLSIEIKADPALMDLITRGLNALGVPDVVATPATATVPETAPAPEVVPAKKPAKERTDHIAKPPAPPGGAQVIDFPITATAVTPPTPAAAPAATAVTLEQARDSARALAAAKGRDAVITLLATFGAKSISDLKATDYAAFMNQALAAAQG